MRRSAVRLLRDTMGQASPEYALLMGIVGTLAVALAGITGDMRSVLDTANYVIHHIGRELHETGIALWRMFAIGW